MIVQIVRYDSALGHDEVAERFKARADSYRAVPGLVQKYYVHYPSTGEYGGVYVWDSEESLRAWQQTQLAGTLEETYKVSKPPNVELTEVMLVLRDTP